MQEFCGQGGAIAGGKEAWAEGDVEFHILHLFSDEANPRGTDR